MSLKSQAIVTAWGNSTCLIFDHPLRICNKIAIKSVYYPKYTVPIKFLGLLRILRLGKTGDS